MAVLFRVWFFLIFYVKVKSQASVTASEQVILNTNNVIIPVLSRSMYSVLQLFLENRVNWYFFVEALQISSHFSNL